MRLKAAILSSSGHCEKIYFPSLLSSCGFLMIYYDSVRDRLGSKNSKLFCGCPAFVSDHVQISVFMDTCECGSRLKQDRARFARAESSLGAFNCKSFFYGI